jgi:hypothetical protein
VATEGPGSATASDSPAKKRLLSEFEDDIIQDPAAPVDELTRYIDLRVSASLSATIDLLPWWRENEKVFPNVAKVARRLLCVPASSAASERSFSVAGLTVSQRRAALDPETVHNILFIHSNAE